MIPAPALPRRRWPTFWLYALALLREFRWTIAGLAAAVLAGGIIYAATPQSQLGGRAPPFFTALYMAWMAMLAEPQLSPPETWHLALLAGVYPLLGIVFIGEGIVRLALLMTSRSRGEKEWMRVMASTHRDHVVLCGLGHLGYRVLEQLLASGSAVVAIEKDPDGRFLAQAKAKGIPVLVRDMKEDQALVDAGVPAARAIIIATNDDMANLEVALDARRMNPGIRVVLRLFDQQIASKIAGALMIDAAFSSSALAAPVVAALSTGTRVLASFAVGQVPHVAVEVPVEPGSALCGRTVAEVEAAQAVVVLSHQRPGSPPASPPERGLAIGPGDVLALHVPASRMAAVAAAGRGVEGKK